jgi:GT2 family glycosyltransferase
MDKIAIIIVHYNTPSETKNCLESLSALETHGFEVKTFVIDNGSKDIFTLGKKYKNVEVVRSNTNLGFTGGNNLGFRYSSDNFNPDYFLLLNSDTLVKPDFLQKLYEDLKTHHDVGLISPKIYFAPGCEYHLASYKKNELGKVLWFVGGSVDWSNLQTLHVGIDEVDRKQFDYFRESEFVSGCCFLIRREVLATAGVFDERYFLYYEDADLTRRVKKLGLKLATCHEAIIWHLNGGSGGGSGSNTQVFYQTRNRLLFFFDHGNLRQKLTVLKFALRLLTKGNRVEKIAARKFFLRQFGKEVVI